jgi:acylphosphatase
MINLFKKQDKSGEKARAHVFAGGRVQGVYYRETCRKKSERLGVAGWVQNLKDGRVEAVFEGEKENVQKMVNWAKRGSLFASVESFDIIWEDYKGEFKKFEIIRILD